MPGNLQRILVLGCGSIGRRHLNNLRVLWDGQLLAYDPHFERLQKVAQETGAVACSSIEEGLDQKPQAVLICTPPHLHLALARQALEAGAHLFIEKPISHTVEGVTELLEAARLRSRIVQVGYHLRFHPALWQLKEWIRQGCIGRVLAVWAEFGQYLPDWRPNDNYEENYITRAATGGGILLDASHEIDYLRWIFGEIDGVTAMMDHVSSLKMETEDLAILWLRFAGGAVGTLHLDCIQRGYTRRCKVIGEEGTLLWDYSEGLRLLRAGAKEWEIVPIYEEPNAIYQKELAAFLSSLRQETPPAVSGEEALRVLEVIAVCRQDGCHV